MQKTPKEIKNAFSEKTERMVNEILDIEREYQHYKDTRSAGSIEREIAQRIIKLIRRGTEK